MNRALVNADCEFCGHHILRHGKGTDGGVCNHCFMHCEKYVYPGKK